MSKFMNEAISEAYKGINHNHGGPFGAVVVKDGEIISKAHNMVVKHNDSTEHAEMRAIRLACKKLKSFDLSGTEIYTTSEPCPMCLGAILWSNIEKVYFGCNISDAENVGFRDKKFYTKEDNLKQQKYVEIDRDKCLELFNNYNQLKNKTNY